MSNQPCATCGAPAAPGMAPRGVLPVCATCATSAYDWTGRRVTTPTGPPTLDEREAPLRARIAELETRIPLGQIAGPFILRRDPHRPAGASPWTAAIPSVGRGDGATPEAALHALAVAVEGRAAELERERDGLRAQLAAEIRDYTECLDGLDRWRARAATAEEQLRTQLAAYAALPPEPDTALGAFMAVLAIDNDAGEHDVGGRDCDGLRPRGGDQ